MAKLEERTNAFEASFQSPNLNLTIDGSSQDTIHSTEQDSNTNTTSNTSALVSPTSSAPDVQKPHSREGKEAKKASNKRSFWPSLKKKQSQASMAEASQSTSLTSPTTKPSDPSEGESPSVSVESMTEADASATSAPPPEQERKEVEGTKDGQETTIE